MAWIVPLIAVVGRLVPIKNHDLFLRAALRLREKKPDARLMIIGDGELRESLEAQVDAMGLRETIIFTGWIKDLAPVYSDLDAVIITSLNEGTPVSLIEAMAARCPVLTCYFAGLPSDRSLTSMGGTPFRCRRKAACSYSLLWVL